MKMSYYPGCSLHGTAIDYEHAIQQTFATLGIELTEIPDWNCCGASSAHMTDHEVAMRLPIRNLLQAADSSDDILVPCAACFQRLKAGDKALRADSAYWDVEHYQPEFDIVHISTFLSRTEVLSRIADHVARPLGGLPVACYYGCLSLRPPSITDARSHETPSSLEAICSCLGARPLTWSYATECCSGSLTMTRPDIATRLVGDITAAARRAGAKALVTDCPMCQSNVESRQPSGPEYPPALPVYFATELIVAAFTGTFPKRQQDMHLVPATILAQYLESGDIVREEPA
jgi:heterodisulfide reductase subunit B2